MDEDQKTESTQEETVVSETPLPESPAFKPRDPQFVTKPKNKKRKIPAIVILIGVILIAILGIVFILKSRGESTETIEAPEDSLSAPATVTPTPTTSQINRDEVSIEILNGTGIAKEASFLQGKLGNLGYTKIETSNSSNQGGTDTIVTFGDDVLEGVVEEIMGELEDIYKKVVKKTSSTISTDIQIVTGLRVGQTLPSQTPTAGPTDTPTPTPTGATTTPTETPIPNTT